MPFDFVANGNEEETLDFVTNGIEDKTFDFVTNGIEEEKRQNLSVEHVLGPLPVVDISTRKLEHPAAFFHAVDPLTFVTVPVVGEKRPYLHKYSQ